MTKPFSLPEAMAGYLDGINTPPSAQQQELIDRAATMPAGMMKTNHESAVLLHLIVQALRPQLAVEVGTFIGYSSLAIGSALPPGGRLICCDINQEWTDIAQEQWQTAGLSDRIELRLGPALDTLQALPAEPAVDFAFIDADKGSYADYYNEIVGRLSPHGLIAVDNTMWGGQLIDDADTSDSTTALRAFNAMVAADARTTNVTIPIGDGVTLIGLAAT